MGLALSGHAGLKSDGRFTIRPAWVFNGIRAVLGASWAWYAERSTTMANHISALKRVRETERRTHFNRIARTRLRNQIRLMRKALAAKGLGEKDSSSLNATMASTFSLLDKAARKGYIKTGTAARYKSRLHTRVKLVTGQTAAA